MNFLVIFGLKILAYVNHITHYQMLYGLDADLCQVCCTLSHGWPKGTE